ncbi:MAG: thermonuclease family protein [Pseudomonadota bacterium]
MPRFPFVLLLCFLLTAALAAGALAAPVAEAPAEGIVREVVDGDTLVLESGEAIRLVGIQAPKLPLGRPDFPAQPLAEEAKFLLGKLTLGKPVSWRLSGRKTDRHGRLLAHLFDAEGGWIQGEMLSQGLARVYSFADNRERVAEMLALEREARDARRGIWADPFYRVLSPEETLTRLGRFELVEGRVQKAAAVKGRGYLNFGEDWRSDFTIVLDPSVRRLFERQAIAIASYAGKRVRVRGWLKSFNGPMIEATHPEQIEILPEEEGEESLRRP